MFRSHRQAFLAQMDEGDLAIFPGSSLANRNHDVDFPFRQNSDFWYLTGLNEADAVLVLAKGLKDVPEECLYLLPRDELQEIWHGIRLGPEGAMEKLGLGAAAAIDDFAARFEEILPLSNRLWLTLGQKPALDRQVIQGLSDARRKIRLGLEPPTGVMDPRPVLNQMRLIKSHDELELMRKSAAISAEAHMLGMAQCKPGMYEYELEALLSYTFRRHGCNDAGWSYPAIVAGGANACILHYTNNDQVMQDGDLVLVDAGGEYQSYAADITRTYPINGKFSPAQRDVYEVVLAAQKASIQLSRPGHTHLDAHNESVKVLTDGLIQMGMLKGSLEQNIEEQTYRRWYMHNTGHWIGLDVHDAGRYKVDGESLKLEPGMVMTIEPGLYFQKNDESVPVEFRGIGIRIEDDIHITGDEPENLTAAVVKELADVEAACAAERVAPPTLETELVS
jgi:Xaa-Pro aminopeptidase